MDLECRCFTVDVAILVFHCYCPLGHFDTFVKRTSFVRLLCSSSLFDKRHDLTTSPLFVAFFFHYTHFFITHSFP